MLRDARARRRSGVDAVVAYRERHGRSATAAQLAGLEALPTRIVSYRGTSFTELDVAAVLDRRPELALVDELAHANLSAARLQAVHVRDIDNLDQPPKARLEQDRRLATRLKFSPIVSPRSGWSLAP
jgi:two-component system, OmpR family, sensor histidine kinase KdpD